MAVASRPSKQAEPGRGHARASTSTTAVDDFGVRRWERLAATRRPWRAFQRMWRAALEGLGAGKRGPAFEDALGMELVRIVGAATIDHPIVLARAGGMDS